MQYLLWLAFTGCVCSSSLVRTAPTLVNVVGQLLVLIAEAFDVTCHILQVVQNQLMYAHACKAWL